MKKNVIDCDCKNQGINIERHIKRMKSKKYIENLKAYPKISEKQKFYVIFGKHPYLSITITHIINE